MVNPGGPGLSATDAAVQSALTLPDSMLGRFDVVGVDPRGVGLSQPVDCIPASTKDELTAADPRPSTADQLDTAFGLADDVAAGCVDKYGDGLGAFSTVDSARDLDRVREALGDAQLSYLGYSYGTTLGSTYAELFPQNVRALVLDGAVDPDADRQQAAEAQAQGFEAAFDAFAANCTAWSAAARSAPTPAPSWATCSPRPAPRRSPAARPARPGRPPPGSCWPPSARRCTTPRPGRSWPSRWPRRRTATRPVC